MRCAGVRDGVDAGLQRLRGILQHAAVKHAGVALDQMLRAAVGHAAVYAAGQRQLDRAVGRDLHGRGHQMRIFRRDHSPPAQRQLRAVRRTPARRTAQFGGVEVEAALVLEGRAREQRKALAVDEKVEPCHIGQVRAAR